MTGVEGIEPPNLRFWRPLLCQLSYTPMRQRNHRNSRDLRNAATGLRAGYLVSLCAVCLRQNLQNLANSNRFVVFFLFFVVT